MLLSWGRIMFRLASPRAILPCTAAPLFELILGTAFCGHVLLAADFAGLGILPAAAGLLGVGIAAVLWSERTGHALPPPDWRAIALFALALGYALAWTWSMVDQYDRYLGGGPYPFWADDFIHAGTINEYGDARSQGRGTLSLADQPRFVYHYASYTLPALASALFDVSGLDAKMLVWMPLSIAMMAAGLAVLGISLSQTPREADGETAVGIQGGVLALLLLCLLPDAAAYGLQNGWYSFHWLVESSPGTGYSIGAGCASLAFLARWAKHRRRPDLIAGILLLLSMFLLRAHVMIWLIPPIGMLLVLGVGRYRLRNRLIVLAGIAVLGLAAMVVLSWQALQADATDFVTKYMTWVHQANVPMAYEGLYAGLVEDLGRLGALPIGLGLALLAFTGVLLIGFAVLATILGRQGRLDLIDCVPFALLATALLMMVLAPTPWHGDYTDFRHRALPPRPSHTARCSTGSGLRAKAMAASRLRCPARIASRNSGARSPRRMRFATSASVMPKRVAISATDMPSSRNLAKASKASTGAMSRRLTFSASEVSDALASSRTWHGISWLVSMTPCSASACSAARRRPPAVTRNFVLVLGFRRTTRFCIRPCAWMLAASSEMPSASTTLRTFSGSASSWLRGMTCMTGSLLRCPSLDHREGSPQNQQTSAFARAAPQAAGLCTRSAATRRRCEAPVKQTGSARSGRQSGDRPACLQ